MKILTYISILFWMVLSINIPENYLKKIDKEVHALFDISTYEKVPVELDESVISKMSHSFDPAGFYRIVKDDVGLGYFYFGKAPSKADEFDYVVIFDQDMIIKKIKILAYREDYGGEISSKRWLRQFDGLQGGKPVKYEEDIKGISGATISARSMTQAVNELLQNLAHLPHQ